MCKRNLCKSVGKRQSSRGIATKNKNAHSKESKCKEPVNVGKAVQIESVTVKIKLKEQRYHFTRYIYKHLKTSQCRV